MLHSDSVDHDHTTQNGQSDLGSTSEPSLVLVNPRKAWIMWTVAVIWLKYCWKQHKTPFNQSMNLTLDLHYLKFHWPNVIYWNVLFDDQPRKILVFCDKQMEIQLEAHGMNMHHVLTKGGLMHLHVALYLSQTSPGFYVSAVEVFWKHCEKRRNCL